MESNDTKKEWDLYVGRELAALTPLLAKLGFQLDEEQKHLMGERYMTRPLGGGRKLLLLGRRTRDSKKVVIKASSEARGIAELKHEHECRRVLDLINFAYGTFLSPEEILYLKRDGYALLITAFVEATPFLERPTAEQFALALKAFKAQESAHATTSSHIRLVRDVFDEVNADTYYDNIQRYVQDTIGALSRAENVYPEYSDVSNRAIQFVHDNREVLDQYGSFLTHWDFTPQNIRVVGEDIYLLDHASIHFGNKYEGWARFINFMVLYNPPLAKALLQYVRDNRTAEELLSLKVMRVYRLAELIRYYTTWLSRTEGDANTLAQTRIHFWTEVLKTVLNDTEIPSETIERYKTTRDTLRSDEEKKRQIGLH